MSTAFEKRYMGRVAALGCALCRRLGLGETPPQVHHRITGRGAGKKAPDTDTVGLCFHHHTGPEGLHTLGRRAWERLFGVTELELIEETQMLLGFCK